MSFATQVLLFFSLRIFRQDLYESFIEEKTKQQKQKNHGWITLN